MYDDLTLETFMAEVRRRNPEETADLSGRHFDLHDRVHSALETEKSRLAQLRTAAGIGDGESREMSPGDLERLKSLGYVQ